MKRFLLITLTLAFALAASAYDFKVNNLCYDINSDGFTVEVVYEDYYGTNNYTSIVGDLVIPSSVTYDGKTYSVVSIAWRAFTSCQGVTSVTIPSSVTVISGMAFTKCSNLTTVIIPNSVTEIGGYAFQDCTSLTTVNVPESVTFLGNFTFENTAWFDTQPDGMVYAGKVAYMYKGTMPDNTALRLRSDTKTIAQGAFRDCVGLKSITIPASTTSIGSSIFANCSNLERITIDSGNTKFDSRNNCNAIIETATNTLVAGCKASTVPNTVYRIGNYSFSTCTGLTSITLPNSVTSIGEDAFYRCTALTSVTLPNSLIVIEKNAFERCETLPSIVIPNSVTTIGDFAFQDCSALTSATIPTSVTSVGKDAFDTTPWFQNLPEGVIYLGGVAYQYKGTMPETVELRKGVKTIGAGLFSWSTTLKSVTIPRSVTTIGDEAFFFCTGLEELICKIDNINAVTMGSSVFTFSPTNTCVLKVPLGTAFKYRNADQWSSFTNIEEIDTYDPGDVDGNDLIDGNDLNVLINILLGKDNTDYGNRANIDRQGGVDGNDLNALINILLGK